MLLQAINEVERLIDIWEKEADWYKKERRFLDPPEDAVYAEAQGKCLAVVRDLKRLREIMKQDDVRRAMDADSTTD